MVAKLGKSQHQGIYKYTLVSTYGVMRINDKLVHANLRIWEPCQIKVSKRLQSEFSLKSHAPTTIFYTDCTRVIEQLQTAIYEN